MLFIRVRVIVPTALDSMGGVLGPGECTDDTGDMQVEEVLGLSPSAPPVLLAVADAPDPLLLNRPLLFLLYLLMKSVELREVMTLARSFLSFSVCGSEGVFLMGLGLLRTLAKLGSFGRGLTTGGEAEPAGEASPSLLSMLAVGSC